MLESEILGDPHYFKSLTKEDCKLELKGSVGLDTLPNQLVSLDITRGLAFNLLVVGSNGCGKSSLVSSLFEIPFDVQSKYTSDIVEVLETKITTKSYNLTEGAVTMRLNVSEVSDFGESIDNSQTARNIITFLDSQLKRYLDAESDVERSRSDLNDTRVHCCLYCIPATSPGLRTVDVLTLNLLCSRCNVLVVITKCDICTKDEITTLKEKILKSINQHNIDMYQFPTHDPSISDSNKSLNSLFPFTAITSQFGSSREREYPWGTVQVGSENHSDFKKLKEAIIKTNMQNLRASTQMKYYESFRSNHLSKFPIKLDFINTPQGIVLDQFSLENTNKLKKLQEEHARSLNKLNEKFAGEEKRLTEEYRRKIEEGKAKKF